MDGKRDWFNFSYYNFLMTPNNIPDGLLNAIIETALLLTHVQHS